VQIRQQVVFKVVSSKRSKPNIAINLGQDKESTAIKLPKKNPNANKQQTEARKQRPDPLLEESRSQVQ